MVRFCLILPLGVLLGGCGMRPNCCQIDDSIPQEWHQPLEGGLIAASTATSNWWEALQDPVLNDLIDDALCGNLDLQITATCKNSEDYDTTWLTVSTDLAKSYIEFRGAQQHLQLIDAMIQLEMDEVKLRKQLIAIEASNDLDLLQAVSKLNEVEAERAPIKAQEQQALNHIALLLGTTRDALCQELNLAGTWPVLPDEIPVGIPSDLLCRRPDIRKAAKGQQTLYYKKTVLSAVEEVENALAAYDATFARVKSISSALAVEQKSNRLVEELYHRGFKSELELLASKWAVLKTEESLLLSRVQLLVDYVELQKALGA